MSRMVVTPSAGSLISGMKERDAWRQIADLGPIILGRQAPSRRR